MKEIKRIFIDFEGLAVGDELPTFEALESSFPHTAGCSGKGSFTVLSKKTAFGSQEPRVGSLIIQSHFLSCDECKVQKQYREK